MLTKTARLEQHAKEAIAKYNEETAGGGEPLFPDWALDLLMVLDTKDKMAEALNLARVALAASAPTHSHYPEPVARHNEASLAVIKALATAGAL